MILYLFESDSEGGGVIVNVVLLVVFIGEVYVVVYCVIKVGLVNMIKVMVMEYVCCLICINVVVLGGMMISIVINMSLLEGVEIDLIKCYFGLCGLVEVDDVVDFIMLLVLFVGCFYYGVCVMIDVGIMVG